MKNFAFLFKLITTGTTPGLNANPIYRIATLLALVLLATPVLSHASDFLMGTVQGTVSASGPGGQSYSAPGARVRLSGASREALLVAVADDSGEYKFGSVPPGSYRLEVALDGFENVTRPITIHAGETTVENVKLELKSVREEVTISASREGVNTSTVEAVQSQVLRNLYAPDYREPIPSFGDSHFIKAGFSYNICNGNPSRYFVSARNIMVHLPRFFSLEIQILKSYRVRLSPKVSFRRNHFYPRDFRGNLDSTNFGMFSNGVGRMFGMRFVIEKK